MRILLTGFEHAGQGRPNARKGKIVTDRIVKIWEFFVLAVETMAKSTAANQWQSVLLAAKSAQRLLEELIWELDLPLILAAKDQQSANLPGKQIPPTVPPDKGGAS